MDSNSYSHCPKCGQRVIDGQFFCGHSPIGGAVSDAKRHQIISVAPSSVAPDEEMRAEPVAAVREGVNNTRTVDAPCNPRPYKVTDLDYEMAAAVLGNLSQYNLRDLLAQGYAMGRELIALKSYNEVTLKEQ